MSCRVGGQSLTVVQDLGMPLPSQLSPKDGDGCVCRCTILAWLSNHTRLHSISAARHTHKRRLALPASCDSPIPIDFRGGLSCTPHINTSNRPPP